MRPNYVRFRSWSGNFSSFSDDHHQSLLHWACFEGHANIVDMLIQRGARMTCMNMGDDTPLHIAASKGHRDVVFLVSFLELLLRRGS